MIARAWRRCRAWFAQRRERRQVRRTADAALRLLRDTRASEVITQPAGAPLADVQAWAMARAMVAALRMDAAERETLEASTRIDPDTDDDRLPHDPSRIDAARRAPLLRLARRIELLRGGEPG